MIHFFYLTFLEGYYCVELIFIFGMLIHLKPNLIITQSIIDGLSLHFFSAACDSISRSAAKLLGMFCLFVCLLISSFVFFGMKRINFQEISWNTGNVLEITGLKLFWGRGNEQFCGWKPVRLRETCSLFGNHRKRRLFSKKNFVFRLFYFVSSS